MEIYFIISVITTVCLAAVIVGLILTRRKINEVLFITLVLILGVLFLFMIVFSMCLGFFVR